MKTAKSTSSIFETTKIKKENIMRTKTTLTKVCIAFLLLLGTAMKSALAQTPLFTQNFNSSSTLSTYINSSSPSNGQFNAISVSGGPTATITGNALQFVRSGAGTASFARTSNFSPVPQGIIYKFDLTVTNNSSSSEVAVWQIGDGFSTSNSVQSDNDCYAQFAIDFRGSNNYRINDITNNDTYSNISGSVKTVTWVLNKSGNTLSYNAPDGTVKTVANDRADLWVASTRYVVGQDIEDNGNIEDMKFIFRGSSGTIIMDNILITQYIPIVTTQPSSSPSGCAGTSISFTAAASGLPTPTVKWQKNISSVWTDISGATSNTYTISSPTALDAGQYRALYTNSEGSTPSNISNLSIIPSPTGGTVNSSASVCSGSNGGTLTLSGNTGTIQKWQSSTNGGSNWNDISNTSSSQSYSNLTQTTMYRAVVISSGCTANSAAATITVNSNPTVYSVTGGGSFCAGGAGVAVGLSDTQSGIQYQLKIGGVNTGSPINGNGNAMSFGNQTATGTYTVTATNTSTTCSANMTGSAAVSNNPTPMVSLAASPNPGCYQSLLTATNTGGTLASINASNNSSVSISSSGTPTVTRTITMPAGYIKDATKITLRINIDHSRAGNLVATLISPSCGQSVIFNRPGGTSNQDNLDNSADYVFTSTSGATFPGSSGGDVPTGTYHASFSGLTFPCSNAAGVWTLQIADMENNGGGSLESWSLTIADAVGYTTVFSGPAAIGAVTYSGEAGSIASSIVTPPAGSNNYSAVTTDALGCISATSNVVAVQITPSIIINSQPSPKTTCVGQSVSFDVSASGTGLSYQWRKGTTNIVDGGRFSGATTDVLTITNVNLSDAVSDYNVVITDANCSLPSTNATLTVNGLPSNPVVTPSSAVLFPGDIQQLSVGNTTSATFGTGASVNTSTTYPAPLGTYYGGARHQILILASELTAQGVLAGEQIQSVAFDVASTNNAHAMTNYTIRIGNTANGSLSGTFIGGLTQVFSTPSYLAVAGPNVFHFSAPFTWNGTSNIIIETVFNNNYLGTSSNPNCAVKYTTTGFTSVNYSREDNAGAGNNPILALSSDGTSNRRPNMVIGHGIPTTFTWTPQTDLYTDAAATTAYTGAAATTVYAMPSASTTYSALATSASGCDGAAAGTAVLTVVTTPPNCVSSTVNNAACITTTSISWAAATNYPSGYYVYVGTDNPPTDLIYQQDVGMATSVNLPTLVGATTYYYQIAPYNINGENMGCTIESFVSGISQTQTPTQAANSYTETMEGLTPPALPCGMTSSNENFPVDAFTWYTSTVAPHNGSRHLRIDKNTNNTTAKDDWFYSAPMNLTAGKLYRVYFWSRVSSASTPETFELFLSNAPDAATMMTTAAIFNGSNNLLVHRLDSSADIIPLVSGVYYYGFHANSPANMGSLYVDDISVREIPVTALNPLSCSTISSLADQLYCNTVYGAQDYKYRIENLNTSFSYEYERNLPIPDFRLIWAPGVLYGLTYDVSVAYKKNNVWSPFGASCPVTIGPFPVTQVKPGICGTAITDQSVQFMCDSVPGANDYEYRIVNSTLGYDHTWSRGNSLTDYRLSWAYQYTPVLVQSLPYGFTYEVQVRALVGRTGAAHGNLPGEYGTFGSVCTIALAGSPQTQLKPSSCGITLTNLTDQLFCIPVSGATDYEYHIENAAIGYSKDAIRNSASTDFRLSWIANSTTLGLRFGTTYDVTVRAKVGGVWLSYGPMCQVTTPAHPSTKLQNAYCNFTLPTFQTTVYSEAIPGVTNYRYHITGPNGYDRVIDRNAPSNDFKFSWTLLCCGQQNMLANTAYQIEVASFAGGVWSAYGPSCTVTTGASVPRYALMEDARPEAPVNSTFSVSVYPNPVALNSVFSIEINSQELDNEKIVVTVMDVLGKIVYSNEIKVNTENRVLVQPETSLSAGLYTIEVRSNSESLREKLVVE